MPPRERVVLLHGLGRTWRSMRRMERAVQNAGYETLNVGYPSFSARVPVLARLAAARIEERWPGWRTEGPPVHMIGHSLGSILIRWMAAHIETPRLGRVILLAPPNDGSRLADFAVGWLTWLMRPLPDLTTDPANIAHSMSAPPGLRIGIIAGQSDRTVPPARARLGGGAQLIVIRSGHMFMPDLREAQDLAVRFLERGRFT